MSYANGTTHYNLPQTVGTDKRDWFDTNQAFANIDADLYSAKETADSTASNVSTIQGQIVTIQSDIESAEGNISTLQSGLATANENIGLNSTKIAEVKADALDMICAVDEGTAQVASVAVAEGEYFRYNDVLYIATDDINVGDTIVPNTNCTATNVATELQSNNESIAQINAELDKGSVSVTADGVKTINTLLGELYSLVDMSKVSGNTYLSESSSTYSSIYNCSGYGNGVNLRFSNGLGSLINNIQLEGNGNASYIRVNFTGQNTLVYEDRTNVVLSSGMVYTVVY